MSLLFFVFLFADDSYTERLISVDGRNVWFLVHSMRCILNITLQTFEQ